MKNQTERSMKAILAASPALLLAGAMFAAPVSAQTMAPDINQPTESPLLGQPGLSSMPIKVRRNPMPVKRCQTS
jgi:hypothetical protein